MFSTGFTLFSVFFFLYPSPSCIVFSYTVFNAISSVLVEVLLINPFANVFFFGGFSIHHKDWLTYSCEADRPGELSYSDPWLLLTQSSSFGFYWSCCFSFQWLFVIAFNCPCAEWEGICDHLRDVPWEDIFTLDASDVLVNFRSGFLVHVYIPHCKCDVMPHSFLLFSAACADSLFHMKTIASVTKSLHQGRGPCYLHLPIFFFYIHSSLLPQNKTLLQSLFFLAN